MSGPVLTRRAFLGATALCLAHTALGQSNRAAKRLGMLFQEPVTSEELAGHPTIARLAELGWVENRTLRIERALADADSTQLPRLAERLVRGGAHVIWVDDFDAALAASHATKTVPIVFCGVAQPMEQGLIDSYARPGRNLTGVGNTIGVGVSGRRMAMLKEIVPKARRLAWLFPTDSIASTAGTALDFSPWEMDAKKAGFDATLYPIQPGQDIEPALSNIVARRGEVLSVGESPWLLRYRPRIVQFANANKLPSAYFNHSFVDLGGLLSFGPDRVATRRLSAEYVDRVLRGGDPATMPVEQPTKFITVVNAGTAKHLGLTIPHSVLVQADRLIQ